MVAAPPSEIFPGGCHDYTLENRKAKIKLPKNVLISTGLYAPPGVLGSMTASSPIILKIGSHDENLLTKHSPWRRWPIVSISYNVEGSDIDVCSPFGGIVYVESDESKNVDITFSGLCKYPRYSIRKDTWTNTKNINVPWGEIELKTLTITLPSKFMKEIEDIGQTVQTLEETIQRSIGFIGIKMCRCRRIIFDVDLLTECPVYGEIIYLLVDDLPNAINVTKPSKEFFRFINLITASSIPENTLDDDALVALATVSTCHCFLDMFPESNPLDFIEFNQQIPQLFKLLYRLSKKRPEAFSKGVSNHMMHRYSAGISKQDLWAAFVNHLKEVTSDRLVDLDDRFKMTRMLESNSSDYLKRYALTEIDNANLVDHEIDDFYDG